MSVASRVLAEREPRVRSTEKYVIIINPFSEHKLGLINIEYKKLGPCNLSCEYRRTGKIVRFSSESDLDKHKTLLVVQNVVFRNDEQTKKYVLKAEPCFQSS